MQNIDLHVLTLVLPTVGSPNCTILLRPDPFLRAANLSASDTPACGIHYEYQKIHEAMHTAGNLVPIAHCLL